MAVVVPFRALEISISVIQRATFFFIGNNLFVIASKKFDGFDPELGDSVQPKTYSVGLNVGF